MNIMEYIEQMEGLLSEAKKVPLTSGKVLVDNIFFREILEDMKDSVPVEISQAKKLVSERANILNAAEREADAIVKSAVEKANQLIAQERIVVEAKARAQQVIDELQTESASIMAAARESSNNAINQAKQEADRIVAEARQTGDSIVATAKRQAEETVFAASNQGRDIVAAADNQASKLMEDSDLAAKRNIERSEADAAKIIKDSEERASMLLMRTNMYIDDMTTKLYKVFANAAEEMKVTHDNLKNVEDLSE